MKSKLPPIRQDWFDENRTRFDAESFTLPTNFNKCSHYFVQKTGTSIGCKNCTAQWTDTRIIAKDGKILAK